MRVIAGKARRLTLKTIEGDSTRPTTDRIKETLFNILQDDIPGSRFLDLFAGSGGIGIEALSRGAKEAVFVEQNRKAAECIRENLVHTKLDGQGKLLVSDAISAIRRMDGQEKFDLIFMDPPYQKDLERAALEALVGTSLLDADTLIIVEVKLNTQADYLDALGYELVRRKIYKTNEHLFIRRKV